MDTSDAAESFRGLLLRHRGRTGLSQGQLAGRLGINRRSIQDWEAGVNHPSAERLRGLIGALLETGGLTDGREAEEAHTLWAVVERDAARMRTPFDGVWFARLLAERAPSSLRADSPLESPYSAASRPAASRHSLPMGEGRGEGGRLQDWGEAPGQLDFVGRAQELRTLRGWVLDERCRLVAVLGMGGIGKTRLAARFARDVAPGFERVYWRSLRDAPPARDWLAGAIGFLSDQQVIPPPNDSERLTILLELLSARRCLLILDNFETLFEAGRLGRYREGLEGYGRVLQAVGEVTHESCMLLTGREAPAELPLLAEHAARRLELRGLGLDEAKALLAPKQLVGTDGQWIELIGRFGGNGLALKVIGETIRELFSGEIGVFLDEATTMSFFGDIRRLLAEQVERSSLAEQQLLSAFAVEREPACLADILAELGPRVGRGTVLEAIEGLRRRSLIERTERGGAFTPQSVVLEYVTDRMVEDISREIQRGPPAALLVAQPLIKALAKDYVRQSQERLIGAPVIQRVAADDGNATVEQRLLALLEGWRGRPEAEQGYGPGNVVNLMRLLRAGDLRNLDLSHLALREAYLQGVQAQDASLTGADLMHTVLGNAIGAAVGVALSADGTRVAAGTPMGEVQVWQVMDRAQLMSVRAHEGGVPGLALSANASLVASGGNDGAVRLWEIQPGEDGTVRPVAVLEAHAGPVWSVALSADGRLLASGGNDRMVRLWRIDCGSEPTSHAVRPLAVLQGHADALRSVTFSGDGRLIASCGLDGTIRLWEVGGDGHYGRPLAVLEAHTGGAFGVALSANGQLVASGGHDGVVRLWDATGGRLVSSLEGHAGPVRTVALSADGRLVASGGFDGAVRLWEVDGGRLIATLEGHTGGVWGVALSADPRSASSTGQGGQLVASGGNDGAVRLWEIQPSAEGTSYVGRPLAVLQGQANAVQGVAMSADGSLVAGGGFDGTTRVWHVRTNSRDEAQVPRPLVALEGQSGGVRGVALSGDGSLVASGGFEGLRLWELPSGGAPIRALPILNGPAGAAWGVAISSDGRTLGAGGFDGAVRVWEVRRGGHSCPPLAVLEGHVGPVWSVALNKDGHRVASGGNDSAVRLWELPRDPKGMQRDVRPVAVLEGHTGVVWAVALDGEGRLVASGSYDGLRLWNIAPDGGYESVVLLGGQAGAVWGVAISADGQLVASGGDDGTVRLWQTRPDAQGGRLLAVFEAHAGPVRSVSLSADGRWVASGGLDGTVKLWDSACSTLVQTLRPDRRCERMDITGLTGITEAQRSVLLALGAVERTS